MVFIRTRSAALACAGLLLSSLVGLTHAGSADRMPGVPGAFAVSPSGAATYRIPIQVPPGVAGMQPNLEVIYNSQSGNGLLGQGWGLSGLSTVTRCPRTQAQDGIRAGVNLDANDRFCLDGQRLILVSGTYGVAGSEYRTEIESFSKVTAVGSAGTGPASFVVKTKSGLTMELGNTTDSRIEAIKAASGTSAWTSGTVRVWAQNKLTDVKGNYLTVAYTEDSATGAYVPSRIDYSGNASASPVLAPGYAVVFVPSGTNRLDAITGYQAGATYTNSKRLAKIQTYAGASLVKEYRLDYAAQASAMDRSKLTTVTECDAVGACLPATSVQWGTPKASAFDTASTWIANYGTTNGWSDASVYPRQVVDINADGLPDIVGFNANGVMVSLNTGTGFATAASWLAQFSTAQGWTNNNVYPRHVVDINGDGLPDIVGFGPGGVVVAINTKTGFTVPSYWSLNQFGSSQGWSDNNNYPRYVVDINGDGLPDIVGFSSSGVMVALNTGTGFAAATNWIAQFSPSQGWTNNSTHPRQMVDMNGDGLPDIVGFAGTGVSVAINTGSGFETASSVPANYSCAGGTVIGSTCNVPATPIIGCPPGAQVYLDGDYQLVCYYGSQNSPKFGQSVQGYSCASGSLQGSTCTFAASHSCPTGYALAGSTCVLSASAGNGSGAWTLAQFGVGQGWTDSNVHPRQVLDINGDGLPDIVGFGPTGVMVSINTGTTLTTPTSWIAQFGVSAGGWTDNNVQPRQLVDVNADGLPDIVGFGPAGVMVALNTGSSFAAASSWISGFGTAANWTNNTTHPRLLVDVTGDGIPDVLGFFSSGVSVASNQQDVLSNYLTKIADGVGAATSTTYSALTASSVYTKDTGVNAASFPQLDIIAPLYVVNAVGSSNGIGNVATMTYRYGGMKLELGTGRGMLGFRWVLSKDAGTNIENYSEFRQDFPYVGMQSKTEQRLAGAGNGGLLKRSTSTLECKIPANGSACVIPARCDLSANSTACATAAYARYFRHTTSTKDEAWDLNGEAYPTSDVLAEYGVDSSDGKLYGDVTRMTMSTSDGATKTTLYEYWPADTNNWILGRLKKTVLTSTVPGAASSGTGTGGTSPAPTVTASQGPSPWVGNQAATLSWSSSNAAIVSYSCTASGTGFTASETDWPNGTSAGVTASDAWAANPSTCVFTAAGPGGTATFNLTVTTVPEPVFNFTQTISTNTLNYNLRAAAVAAGWDQIKMLNASISINTGVYVGSIAFNQAAVDTGASFPTGSTLKLINNGFIFGKGGDGGNSSASGQAGGPALKTQFALAVTNNGTIAGGGGGGGGGGGEYYDSYYDGAGGGGGGGRGYPGGAAGQPTDGWGSSDPGQAGSISGVGGGGTSLEDAGAGGSGGGLGAAGNAGEQGKDHDQAYYLIGRVGDNGAGGLGGAAVVGNANVTWVVTGTRLGALQ
jgi:hypothetical protein